MEKKKLMVGLLLGVSPFLLAGCGDKKDDEESSNKDSKKQIVSCVQKEEEDGVTIEGEMKFTYDKSKKEFIDGQMILTYVIEDDDTRALFEDADMCEDLDDSESIYKSCKTSSKGNKISATVELDLDEMEKVAAEDDDEELKFRKDMKPEELKKSIEESDFTCTIK